MMPDLQLAVLQLFRNMFLLKCLSHLDLPHLVKPTLLLQLGTCGTHNWPGPPPDKDRDALETLAEAVADGVWDSI